MKKFALFIVLLVMAGSALAANDTTGTNPGNFLKLGGGARPISLGGAFVALADDINAIYWNPAGLTQLKSLTLSSMYNSYLVDIIYSNLSFTVSAPKLGLSTGLALDYGSAGRMEETTASQPQGTGRTFTPAFIALTAPFAFQPIPSLSFGLNAKVLMDKIDTGEAIGYGLVAGILWKVTDSFSAGFCARNLAGTLMETNPALPQTNTALASNYALGVCYRLPSINLALDYNMPSDNQGLINLGAEYNLKDTFFGRIGFSTRSEENAGGNLGAGLGLKFGMIKLDYAYAPYNDLGITHRLAFSLIFPERKAPAVTAEAQASAEAIIPPPIVTPPPPAPIQITEPASPEAPAIIESEEEPVVVVKKAVAVKKVKVVKKKSVKKRAKKPRRR